MNAMRNLVAASAASAVLSGGCLAQSAAAPVVTPAAAPVAVAPAAPAMISPAAVAPVAVAATGAAPLLRQGTEIRLKTISALSSKFSKLGDRFEFLTTEDVKVNGQIVIPAGTRGVGEVTKVEKKGAFGKSGDVHP